MTAAPVLARSLKFSLQISQGENVGQVYSFDKTVVTIGRGPQNDVILAHDPKASRQHVELKVEAGFLRVKNLTDRNFILINGEKIDQKYIQVSSTLQIGDTILKINIETPPPTPAASASMPVVTASSAQSGAALKVVPRSNPAPSAYTPPPPQAPPLGGAQTAYQPARNNSNGSSRLRFYMMVLVIGGAVAWFLMDSEAKKKADAGLRTEGDIVRAIEDSATAVKELKKQQETGGQNSLQYRAAQEHYVKGFRDYRQRQYARAMQSFQAALSFYPAHELARKYLVQAQRKFEENVDSNMSLGRKYYQRQNYKLCQSSFANVMIMLKDASKPKYREAKQFYDECSLRLEGRF